jgi:plasmid stabilization system protein ParE
MKKRHGRLSSAFMIAFSCYANSPESGHRYEKYPEKHIRILLYGHYRVAYLIRDENTIHILGVLHGALDIDEHLKRIL